MDTTDIKRYIDLRIKEIKLKASDSLSSILALIVTILLAAVIAIMALTLVVFAVMQWLNRPDMLGDPWGTVIAVGFLLIVLLLLFLIGKNSLRKILSRSISGALGDETDDARKSLNSVRSEIHDAEIHFRDASGDFPNNLISGITMLASAVSKIRRLF